MMTTRFGSILRWTLAALVCACTGDTSSPNSTLVLPTGTIALSAIKGDSASQTIAIGSTGSAISWTATSDVPWIIISPTSGTTPATVSLKVRSADLTSGSHAGNVTVRADGPTGDSRVLPVALQVAPARVLAVSPSTISLSGILGQIPVTTRTVSVDITDGANANWSASSNATWLTVSPAAGTGSGQITLRIDPAGLAAAAHTATLTVVAPSTGNSPMSIPVSLTLVRQHTISVSAAPAGLGSVSGAGTYNAGQTATVTATAAAGAEFLNWTQDGVTVSTSATYTFTVNADRSLVANFRSTTVTISTASNPSNGGSTTGAGQYQRGAQVTVNATPAVGFAFASWTEGGNVVSTDRSYIFTATAPRALVSNFIVAQTTTVAISTSASPTVGGTTAGGGIVTLGTSVTIAAFPANGYAFVSWTQNGTVLSTFPTYTFTAAGDRSLVANFTPGATTSFTILASPSPAAGGTTTGTGAYASGSSVVVRATANSGYAFSNWTEGGAVVATTPTYSFTVVGNRHLVANFTSSVQSYTVTTAANPSVGGVTSGTGTYVAGSVVSVGATPSAGYTFVSWSENGAVVSFSQVYSFNISGHRALVATFQLQPSPAATRRPPLDF